VIHWVIEEWWGEGTNPPPPSSSFGDRGGLPGWQKDERQAVGVSLLPLEKKAEDEEDWNLALTVRGGKKLDK
jgi:hypothetical protein